MHSLHKMNILHQNLKSDIFSEHPTIFESANHMGMRICGISCISNLAAGMTANPLTHEEVQEAADMAAPNFKKLVTETVKRMAAE